jgi:hypothetical protein
VWFPRHLVHHPYDYCVVPKTACLSGSLTSLRRKSSAGATTRIGPLILQGYYKIRLGPNCEVCLYIERKVFQAPDLGPTTPTHMRGMLLRCLNQFLAELLRYYYRQHNIHILFYSYLCIPSTKSLRWNQECKERLYWMNASELPSNKCLCLQCL